MRTTKYLASFAATIVLAFAPGCGDDPDEPDAADDSSDDAADDSSDDAADVEPRDYYDGEASAALGASTNTARCATCHSDDASEEGFSGDSLQDIAYKTSYKGGGADLLGAVNACVTGWMGGPALTATDPEFLALVEFFETISDAAATTPNALMPEVLADEAAFEAAYAAGDAAAGATKYDSFCGECHDAAVVVGSAAAPPKSSMAAASIGRIARQVRTSGPPPSGTADASDSTPGPMPFFEPDELSAQDLADIIAHVRGG